MFISDKEKVVQKLNDFVNTYYYSGPGKYQQFNNESDIGSSIRECVREAINHEINMALKEFGRQLVNTIVDELYDNNDFEKDIGLR